MYVHKTIHKTSIHTAGDKKLQIKYRNIVRNEENIILSGSAALVENTYARNESGNRLKNHTKQTVVERLGKVIWINEDNKNQAIFNSPTRGLVFYDLAKDEFTPVDPSDSRLAGTQFEARPARIHTSFGNPFLFLSEMEKTPFMRVLRETFQDRVMYEKALAHLTHDCLRNGASIKCGEYLKSSILTYILRELPVGILDCDTPYFTELSDDNLKTAFFKSLVQEMRETIPGFGTCCYVDSTPLPGDASNNPFNALSSHGTDGTVVQARLVLILDIQTDIPVWFEIIPSNVLDKSTILSITNDVKATLDIDIEMYDLDAGYARKELFELFNRDNSVRSDESGRDHDHTVLVRMPATNGYPRDELYIQCKPHFYSGRYSFDYEHHTFFGERIEVDLFGYPEYAFVFIDKTQAESLLRGWREQHSQEWEELSDSAQDWYQVKDGFFVLIGNRDQSPKEALIEYRGRARIEGFFRDAKTYLRILPIAKWNKQTVTGKIFHDIMETIFYREYRKRVAPTNMNMSSLIVCMDSWEAFKQSDEILEVKTPKVQVREALEKMGYVALGHLDLAAFRLQVLEGIPMPMEPITARTKRGNGSASLPVSPEEKREEREKAAAARAEAEANRRIEKAELKAERDLAKAKEAADQKRKKRILSAKKKRDQVLSTAKREQTKDNARATYESAVAAANADYKSAVAEAKSVCGKAKTEARRKYTTAQEG